MKAGLKNKITQTLAHAEKDGFIFWGFAVNEEGDFEAFTNQEWSEEQLCAATVEAIQKIDAKFVKEA